MCFSVLVNDPGLCTLPVAKTDLVKIKHNESNNARAQIERVVVSCCVVAMCARIRHACAL